MDRANRPKAYSEEIGLCLVISIDWEFETALLYDELTDPEYKLNEIELVWPTGLKDKNGQEIYEGDIVKRNGSDRFYPVEFRQQYADYMLMFSKYNWRDKKLHRANITRYDMEVVGNIYENPELLED